MDRTVLLFSNKRVDLLGEREGRIWLQQREKNVSSKKKPPLVASSRVAKVGGKEKDSGDCTTVTTQPRQYTLLQQFIKRKNK